MGGLQIESFCWKMGKESEKESMSDGSGLDGKDTDGTAA